MPVRRANSNDVTRILGFIKELAVYEKLEDEVVATEKTLKETLFGDRSFAEVLLAETKSGEAVGFALFFHNYSTFLAKPGIYLEDLFVQEKHRGQGYGKALLAAVAKIAVSRDCGRLEWSVLNWNKPSIDFYKRLGSVTMDEWHGHRLTGESLKALTEKPEGITS